jgi:hypothetical protein
VFCRGQASEIGTFAGGVADGGEQLVEANASVLRRFLKRLRERVSFRESGVVRVDEGKLAKEMEVEQHELMGELLERAEASIRRSSQISAADRAMLLATDLPQNER